MNYNTAYKRRSNSLQGKSCVDLAEGNYSNSIPKMDLMIKIAMVAFLVGSFQEAYAFTYPSSQRTYSHNHQIFHDKSPSLSRQHLYKSLISSISNSCTILSQKSSARSLHVHSYQVNKFGIQSKSALSMVRGDKSSYDASKTWSRPATISDTDTNTSSTADRTKRESRFGVRSRVRSVLKKAKQRTGIRNNSEASLEKKEPSPQSVIAEAASIGGLGAVVVDDEGTIDVALDYVNNATDMTSAPISRTKKKKAPASTYSPSSIKIERGPEDRLRTSSPVKPKTNTMISERDAFTGDVSAAFSLPSSPLPFTLPNLSREQINQVNAGKRVQFQNDMGREGSGFVVVDVKAPPEAVWDCLLDFESYPETIPTVRSVDMKSRSVPDLKHGKASETRASFSLSKFRLNVAAIHKYRPHPEGDYMVFTLDPSCTNMVLQKAKGVWYTQKDVDGREGITRVWLLCELKVSNLLPIWIVDYAARKAMPRATTWLKPQVEAAASLWLRESLEKENEM